jgi:hypothetical protein
MERMRDFLLRLFFPGVVSAMNRLQLDNEANASESVRLEQQVLGLRQQLDEAHQTIARRPTVEMVDMLKQQVDHLAIRHERRAVYHTAHFEQPMAENAKQTSEPQPLRAKNIREMIAQKLAQERMGGLAAWPGLNDTPEEAEDQQAKQMA